MRPALERVCASHTHRPVARSSQANPNTRNRNRFVSGVNRSTPSGDARSFGKITLCGPRSAAAPPGYASIRSSDSTHVWPPQ